jgi:hypothetical protein
MVADKLCSLPWQREKQEEWHVGIIITMSVEYGPEVGDGGEGEHISGLRMHKAHFLSREPRHVSSTGEVDVLVACGEARLVMDWKYLHRRDTNQRSLVSDRESGGEAGTGFRQMLSCLRTSFVVSRVS